MYRDKKGRWIAHFWPRFGQLAKLRGRGRTPALALEKLALKTTRE